MAYETGVSTSEEDLLAKIAVFAAARGWTVHTGGLGGDAPSGQVSMNSDDLWVHAIAVGASDRIHFQPSTGYTAGGATAFEDHPGSPDTTAASNTFGRFEAIPGPHTAYYLFGNDSSPRYIHCVVEVSSGVYSHWHFGTVEKFGTYTGGGYVTSLIWSGSASTSRPPFASAGASIGPAMTSVHAQWFRTDGVLGAASPNWTREFGPLQNAPTSSLRSAEHMLWMGGLMPVTQRTILAPIFFRKNLTVSSVGRNVNLGRVQDVRMVSMEFHSGGDEIIIGSDTWKIFPPRAKDTAAIDSGMTTFTTTSSGYWGLAFRKFV